MMNLKQGRYYGVFPILATPFDAQGEVDYESLRRLMRFEINAGIHGLGLFGNASEGYALTEPERENILAIVKEESQGKLPLIISSGNKDLETAVRLSKRAEKDGAAALMVMAQQPEGKTVYDYYAAIASAVNVPIMIQDAPIASGVQVPAETVGRLVREFENIQYIKVEAPPTIVKCAEVLDATQGEITMFGGLNSVYMYEEMEHGCVGTMPACEFPEIVVAIFDAYQNGDKEKAREIFVRHLPLFRMGTLPGYAMSIHKDILRRRGVTSTGAVRKPNNSLPDCLIPDVELLMKELEII